MTDFAAKLRWDIFCKIVDNFGDIGVCWRLARQLQSEHGLQIRLWVDDLEAAKAIIPNLKAKKNSQVCAEITILKWDAGAEFNQAADVVIEAFACGLPSTYLIAMVKQNSKWVNLEYLSAEPWVADFHGKPSPQHFLKAASGLTRYFYFPGFTEKTGGLIREADLMQINQLDSNSKPLQSKRWQSLNISYFAGLNISLFCYPHAPIGDLLDALANSKQLINCYVPASSMLPKIAQYFGKKTINIGDNIQQKNLQLQVLPFLSQPDYDALLWACDLNFVRGEDSWVRAIWAGKPFIWQPYFQDENTHIKKLNAYLDMFYAGFEAKQVVCEAHSAWLTGQLPTQVWQNYLLNLSAIKNYTQQQSIQLAKQADLAAKLVIFCNQL